MVRKLYSKSSINGCDSRSEKDAASHPGSRRIGRKPILRDVSIKALLRPHSSGFRYGGPFKSKKYRQLADPNFVALPRRERERRSSPLCSPLYVIRAGTSRKCFGVHSAMLARSGPLAALVGAHWLEGSSHDICLPQFDEDTVGRFVQWLYHGDYTCPDPVWDAESETPPDEEYMRYVDKPPPILRSSIRRWISRIKGTMDAFPNSAGKDGPHPLTPSEDFEPQLKYFLRRIDLTIQFRERELRRDYNLYNLDWEAVMLSHAKLYIMADYFLVEPLTTKVLRSLGNLLLSVSAASFRNVTPSLVSLISYIYNNTQRLNSKHEPLRRLVTFFVVTNWAKFSQKEIDKLIVVDEDFAEVLRSLFMQVREFNEDCMWYGEVADCHTERRIYSMIGSIDAYFPEYAGHMQLRLYPSPAEFRAKLDLEHHGWSSSWDNPCVSRRAMVPQIPEWDMFYDRPHTDVPPPARNVELAFRTKDGKSSRT